MAQLNDLLVSGASRLLNGLGILGTTNSDSILPNVTDTYVLGESGKRWNSAHIKTITGSHITLDTLTVNNYATIGGGQAATAKNTGALRVKGGLSTEQQSYFYGGAIFAGAADSSARLYVFGDKTAQHISMGDAGIQAYSNNTPTPSKLYLQYNGGDLDIGKSGHTGTTTIYGPLNYAGFSAASDNVDRVVWFSYNGTIGRPVYDNDFKYNPSTNRLTLGRLYLTNTEGVTHIQFSRANYNYVIAPTGGSIAFGANGATGGTQVSLVVSASQVIPGQNNGSIELGAPDYAWKSLYTRNVYWDDGNGKQNAYTSYTSGTASTTEGTNGTQGYFNLFLGNSTAISSTVGQGAGNSRGRLYIYGRYGYSSNITSNAADSNKNIDIPNYSGYMLIGNNTVTNPTEDTTYYIPFYLTVHQRTSANNGLRYRTLEGTTSTTGYGGIYLGNSTASGIAGNKYGFIRMYASNSNFTTILSQGNGNRDFYLPNYAGTMYAIHAGNNNAVGAGDKPVYIAANGRVTAFSSTIGGSTRPVYINAGTVTAITAVGTAYGGTGNTSFTGNRLVWSETATKLTDGYHYADSSKVAINHTSAPSENFYVGGTSRFTNTINLNQENNIAMNFRPGLEGYYTTISYQTSGNEAMVFATKNIVTSFMFVNGEDSITNHASSRWTEITPALQIKNNSVYIGSLIGEGVTPSYKFYVNGTTYLNGASTINGATTVNSTITASGMIRCNGAPIFGYRYSQSNNAPAFVWDKPGNHYTGMGANGSGDTIYFGPVVNDGTWTWASDYKQKWVFNGTVTADSFIGTASIATIARSLGTDESMKLYAQYSNEVNFGGANASDTIFFGYRAVDSKPIPSSFIFGGSGGTSTIRAGAVYGAVWNDYAEYRETKMEITPGRVIIETGHGDLILSTERLQPGGNVVSDTFGFAIGETDTCKTPIAVSGRVLVYPYEDRYSYEPGDAVCTGPNGTVSKMTREEIWKYPERIVGTVSEIPEYETWGTGNAKVDGRIWIKVRLVLDFMIKIWYTYNKKREKEGE